MFAISNTPRSSLPGAPLPAAADASRSGIPFVKAVNTRGTESLVYADESMPPGLRSLPARRRGVRISVRGPD